MLANIDSNNIEIYNEVMNRLNTVQNVMLCNPSGTAGDICGFFGSEKKGTDSHARDVVFNDSSMKQLSTISELLAVSVSRERWNTQARGVIERRFVVGLDHTEHALDIDAENATAEFDRINRIEDVYPDLYNGYGKFRR